MSASLSARLARLELKLAKETTMAKTIRKSGDPKKPWKLGKVKTTTRAAARSVKASKKVK